MDTLDGGMIYVPGIMKQDGKRFDRATQNSMQFKTQVLFISGIFNLTLLNWGIPTCN